MTARLACVVLLSWLAACERMIVVERGKDGPSIQRCAELVLTPLPPQVRRYEFRAGKHSDELVELQVLSSAYLVTAPATALRSFNEMASPWSAPTPLNHDVHEAFPIAHYTAWCQMPKNTPALQDAGKAPR